MSVIPEGSVVITPTEMYRELRDTHDEVKALSASVNDLSESLRNIVGDHESRIRALEKMVWRAAGAAAVVGAGLSYAVEQFTR